MNNAIDLPAGQRAMLQSDASRARMGALNLNRAPMNAADEAMAGKRRDAAKGERVLIRARRVWVQRGMHRHPETRYDVFRVNGKSTELAAAGIVWWEEALQRAISETLGRVTVAVRGQNYSFGASGQKVIDAVGTLAGDGGKGWKRPEPGEVLVVK